MTHLRDCWRRDLSALTPQQRRAAGYALRLLGLPRDLSERRLDTANLALLWGMLQPLFEPQGLARYLRPPPARVRLADPEGIDPEVPDDEGGDASWAVSSDEDLLQGLRVALKEEDSLSGEEGWGQPPREIPRHHLLLRLRGLFRRIPPTVKARLDRANPEDAPASATVALLGASLDMEGAALRVLDFLDAFVASPNLGLLLRHLGDRSSVAVNYRRLAHMLNLVCSVPRD